MVVTGFFAQWSLTVPISYINNIHGQIYSSIMIHTIAQYYLEACILNSCHKAISICHFIRHYITSSLLSSHFLSRSFLLFWCCLYDFIINNTWNVSTFGYNRAFTICYIMVMADLPFPKLIFSAFISSFTS